TLAVVLPARVGVVVHPVGREEVGGDARLQPVGGGRRRHGRGGVVRVGRCAELTELVIQRALLEVRQEVGTPAPLVAGAAVGRRQVAVLVVVAVQAQGDLLEVVGALALRGGLADLLDGGHEQGNQDGNDGDDDQQLDQRETRGPRPGREARRVHAYSWEG